MQVRAQQNLSIATVSHKEVCIENTTCNDISIVDKISFKERNKECCTVVQPLASVCITLL